MNEFTFITVTYNHEKYIVEHLESIKTIINHYGKNIHNHLIIIDDCSKDQNCTVIAKWLKENQSLFASCQFIQNEVNQGTIHNVIHAYQICPSNAMHLLAGDDRYLDHNIYEVCEEVKDGEIVVTPIIPFGNPDGGSVYVNNFRMLFLAYLKGKVKELIQYDNFIPAPSVFVNRNTVNDPALFERLSRYRNIEDYPTWHYLLVEKNVPCRVVLKPLIGYRLNAGISNRKVGVNQTYNHEIEQIRKDLKVKRFLRPFKKNIHCYLFAMNKVLIRCKKKEINSYFEGNEELKCYIKP